jgi:hypothetical protein
MTGLYINTDFVLATLPISVTPFGAAFENADGTATIVTTFGNSCALYKTSFLTVPIYAPVSTANTYQVVVSVDQNARTNVGVNVGVRSISSGVGSVVHNANGMISNAVINTSSTTSVPVRLSCMLNVSNQMPFAIMDELSASAPYISNKWTYFWYDYPSNYLTTVAEYVYDPTNNNDSFSITAVHYDGLGLKNAADPTLIRLEVIG